MAMKEIPTLTIAAGAMLVALIWSLLQGPAQLQDTSSLPLPTIAGTVEASTAAN
jgi:hypothetical protein